MTVGDRRCGVTALHANPVPVRAVRRGPKPGRRFPFEPLYAFLTANPTRWATDAELKSGRPSDKQLAEMLDAHPSQVNRWRKEGLTEKAADRVAIRLGLHPLIVWPDYHDDEEAA